MKKSMKNADVHKEHHDGQSTGRRQDQALQLQCRPGTNWKESLIKDRVVNKAKESNKIIPVEVGQRMNRTSEEVENGGMI